MLHKYTFLSTLSNIHTTMVNNYEDTLRLTTSSFEHSWFKQQLENDQELRQRIIENALQVQRIVERDWTDDVRVSYNDNTHLIDIYVMFQADGRYSYIKESIEQ